MAENFWKIVLGLLTAGALGGTVVSFSCESNLPAAVSAVTEAQ